MLWAPALLLAFLAPASQISFNSEWRKLSITQQNGSSAVITCDIVDETINYIHWYRHQEGKAPQRLLYFSFTDKKIELEDGISPEKYDVYKGLGRVCNFVIQNLEESDAGVYYCAAWDSHSDSGFPSPAHNSACSCQVQPWYPGWARPCLTSCPDVTVLRRERSLELSVQFLPHIHSLPSPPTS